MLGSWRLRKPLWIAGLLAALVATLLSVPATTLAVSQAGRLLDEGAAEFVSPWGLATDEFGDIYVSDLYNNRIVKFDGATKQAEWIAGSQGPGDGQLHGPQGIAIADGTVYVADTLNHRIAMFTQEGAWAGSVVGEANAFAYPTDVDYLNGLLFVAEGGGRCRVQIVRKTGNSYNSAGTVGSCGGQPGQLSSPTGVAVTETEIFVADAQLGVVKKFDYAGNHLLNIGAPGTGPGQLDGPWAVAVTKTETEGTHVWVIEAGSASRAQRFTGEGVLVDVLTGTNSSHFSFPHGIALSPTEDVLYIADTSGEDPNVYSFIETDPELIVAPDDNLKRLVKTEGIWFGLGYNQATKTCKVLSIAKVSVPGHPRFTVEEDFRVKSLADDFKVDVSNKQAKWMKRAEAANKKVPVSATFRGTCTGGAKVSAKEDYKAG